MKLITVFSIITLVAGANAATMPENKRSMAESLRLRTAKHGGEALAERDAEADSLGDLETRACVPSDCSCEFIDAGLFCGDGLLGCKRGTVYQCSGGKKSCSYGKRDSCQKCDKLQC